MPTPAEGLSPASSAEDIQKAISGTIAQLIEEGMPQEQAVAAAYSMAEQSTGKKVPRRSVRLGGGSPGTQAGRTSQMMAPDAMAKQASQMMQ